MANYIKTLLYITLFNLICVKVEAQGNWISPNKKVHPLNYGVIDTGFQIYFYDSNTISFLLQDTKSKQISVFKYDGQNYTETQLDTIYEKNHPTNLVVKDSFYYLYSQNFEGPNSAVNKLAWRPTNIGMFNVSTPSGFYEQTIVDSILSFNKTPFAEGIHDMVEYNGALYFVTNNRGLNGVLGSSNYFYYDKKGIHSMGTFSGDSLYSYVNVVRSNEELMHVYRDSLYVVHSFGYAVWYKNKWIRNVMMGNFDYRCFIPSNDSLYICENATKKLINISNGDKVVTNDFSKGMSNWDIASIVAYKNSFMSKYSANNFELRYYDRTKNQWLSLANCNLPINHYEVEIFEFKGNLYAYGNFQYTDKNGDTVRHLALLEDNGIINISGHVYIDKDTSCSYTKDSGLVNRAIEIYPGLSYVSTDSGGQFSFFALAGQPLALRVVSEARNYIVPSCAKSSYTFTPERFFSYDTLDFAYRERKGYQDLQVDVSGYTGSRVRMGFTEGYVLTCRNLGNTNVSGVKLKLTYDLRQRGLNATPSPTDTSANTALWNLGTLNKGDVKYINFELNIDTAKIDLNDTLILHASLEPFLVDSFSDDNFDTLHQRVVSSFDPNYKLAYPTGETDTNYVKPNWRDIEYTIHFENLGTSDAENIVVTDTISSDLEISYIQFTGYSHSFKFELVPLKKSQGRGLMKMNFNNIKLPPKQTGKTDDISSQGFVSYKIKLKESLPVGSIVDNTASIFFDYNQPVITNTVYVKVVEPSSTIGFPYIDKLRSNQIQLYPNPGSDFVYIVNQSHATCTFSLTDMAGRILKAGKVGSNNRFEIATNELSNGVYMINIYEDNGEVMTCKWIKN